MSDASRRGFLQSAGALAAAAQAPEPAAAFRPGGAPRQLGPNLWVFEDTCNVYVVKSGEAALLIDFGSGAVLEQLGGLGVRRVEWILHTHHHRDQCQGDARAVRRRIPIAVPAHEAHLFADAENFWRNRRVFHLYYVRNDFHTLTRNVAVERLLEDYTTFAWRGIDFSILPTPGHTLGSITLLATIDGRRTAFSGDLMYAPGKILNLYDTQINYGGAEGVDMAAYSLAALEKERPALLCPSHGEPLAAPEAALRATRQRLADYYRFQTGEPSIEYRPYAVSPHLVASYQTMSSFYAIVSDSGKAMFIDYGAASNHHFGTFERATPVTGRIRFVEHTIDALKTGFNVKAVDVAMPSHMHDDHMNGFPHLKRHHGTRVWCLENMVDVFQNPRGYNLGCILGEPFQVDRSFRDGEKFRWEEFEFEITHSPGHTEYQMALHTTIDGRKVAFTGDAVFERAVTLRHNIIYRNHVENDSHLKSMRGLVERQPSLICPGHGRPYAVTPELLAATEKNLGRQQQFFFDLLPEGETDFGLDPSWVRIYPYQALARPGRRLALQIHVQNYLAEEMKVEAALVAPPEWDIQPRVVTLLVPARGKGTAAVQVLIPRGWSAPAPRFAIAADVRRNGRYLGQVTEAIVEMEGVLKPSAG